MSLIKDGKEEIEALTPVIKSIIAKTADSQAKRLSVFLSILFIIYIIIWLSTTYVLNRSLAIEDKNAEQTAYLSDTNSTMKSLNTVNICLTAIEKNNANRDWYCKLAQDSYKDAVAKYTTETHVTKVIKNNAYEYMQVDLKDTLKQIEYKYKTSNYTNQYKNYLNLLVGTAGKISLVILILLIAFSLIFAYIKENKRKKLAEEIDTEALSEAITTAKDIKRQNTKEQKSV